MAQVKLSCGHTVTLPTRPALGQEVRCPWCEPIKRAMLQPPSEARVALDSMQIVYGQPYYDQFEDEAPGEPQLRHPPCTFPNACYGMPF